MNFARDLSITSNQLQPNRKKFLVCEGMRAFLILEEACFFPKVGDIISR